MSAARLRRRARDRRPSSRSGILDGEARAEVLLHLDHCPTCQRYVSRALGDGRRHGAARAGGRAARRASSGASSTGSSESSRRRRWRTTKLVAVTAAAAVDPECRDSAHRRREPHPTSQSAAPAGTAKTVPMVGGSGQHGRHGRRGLDGPDHDDAGRQRSTTPCPTATTRSSSRRSGPAPAGRSDRCSVSARPWQLVGERRRWPGLPQISVVDKDGPTRCSAKLPHLIVERGYVQALGEEGEHPVERVAGGVTGLVDEVLGEHRVRAARDAVRVALRRVDLHRDERVAELVAQRLEPLARHRGVLGEAQAHDARAVLRRAPSPARGRRRSRRRRGGAPVTPGTAATAGSAPARA